MSLSIENRNQDHLHPVIENFIIIAIILVIVQTILEELSAIYLWSHDTNVLVIWAGFLFDLLFSVEFIVRTIVTARKGHFSYYFKMQRGWIDLLTSFPLLFLVSGPAVVNLILDNFGAASGIMAFLHILKAAKAVRVTRILRLIRVLKIMGKIQNAESTMTNRHVASVATSLVVSIVIVLVAAQYLPFTNIGDHDLYYGQRMQSLETLLQSPGIKSEVAPHEKWVVDFIKKSNENSDIIRLKNTESNQILYEHPRHVELIWTAFNERKFIPIGETGYAIQLSYHLAGRQHSKLFLFSLILILVIVLVMMTVFSRQFAQQIADPIYVMNKGIRQWDYNLEVKIDPDLKEDEIFILARAYNERWLVLKNQIRNYRLEKGDGTDEKSAISIDDII